MFTHPSRRILAAGFFTFTAIALPAFSAAGSGGSPPAAACQLAGSVTDPGGLPVAHARIVARDVLRGAVQTSEAGDDGRFTFPPLACAAYMVSAAAAELGGPARRVALTAAAPAQTLAIQLQVGTLHETITVVSASRIGELQSQSPVQVDAVTRQQTLDTGYERVSDLLAEVPGVVVRRTNSGSVSGAQINGVDSRQVLILQDGLPLVGARGVKSGVVNLNRQSTMRLEQVEVVKGAASTMFGSDAIGGVINQITRDPASPLEFQSSISGGSLGSVDADFSAGGRWRRLSLLGNLERHRQDAYALIPGSYATVGPLYRRNNGFAKARYSFGPNAVLSFTADAYHNHEEGKTSSSSGPTRSTSNDSTQSFALVGDFILPGRVTLQARAYAARYDENGETAGTLTGGAASSLSNLNERYRRLDATVSRDLPGHQLLQGGVEWSQDQYRGANRMVGDNAGQQVTTADYWLQDRIQLTSRALVTVGGRLTHHSLFGSYVVPRVGAVYRLSERFLLRGSFGKGFRAPDLGQLYYRFANPASYYQVIGNPNLEPENSRSFSAGAEARFARVRIGANLFHNNLNRLIETQSAGTPQTAEQLAAILAKYGIPATFQPLTGRLTYTYMNVSRAFTEGAEGNVEVKVTRSLTARGGYSYLVARDRTSGLALTQRSRHQGFAQTSYYHSRTKLAANIRGSFLSSWLLDAKAGTRAYGYGMWDAFVSRELRRGVSAFAAIDNLANSRDRKLALATPSFDRADYGRTWRTGLRFTFGTESH
jgi:outer membrane receptor for ferrienterochelin and colicins